MIGSLGSRIAFVRLCREILRWAAAKSSTAKFAKYAQRAQKTKPFLPEHAPAKRFLGDLGGTLCGLCGQKLYRKDRQQCANLRRTAGELLGSAVHRAGVEELRQVSVTGQGFALFPVHQDLHSTDAGNIRCES